ncbi:FIG00652343: hypothetical protein [hydrothermal vent metagenome]|uniref:DUF192 domain-containing protein n=1 Tax=hydrothermal vent metagenome TaxID=652676 RepID=A0A3B0TSF6_9ZZZZ
MKILTSVLLIGCAFLFLHSCKEASKKTIKTTPIEFKKEGELTITKQKIDTLITTFNIEFAESDYETETGLMYRQGMAENEGMLFIFDDDRLHNFYMKNTEFSLDIIFIDKNMKIASFQENAQPYSKTLLSSQVPIQYVLEVNAGLAEKWLLEIGDKIEFHKN